MRKKILIFSEGEIIMPENSTNHITLNGHEPLEVVTEKNPKYKKRLEQIERRKQERKARVLQ